MTKELHDKLNNLKVEVSDDLAKAKKIAKSNEWLADVALDVAGTNDKLNTVKRLQAKIDAITAGKSMPVSDEQVELARTTDIRKLYAAEYLSSTGNGRFTILCPFHEESNPSCMLYPGGKGYYCFGCCKGGDAIEFVMTTQNMDFIKAVEYLLSI